MNFKKEEENYIYGIIGKNVKKITSKMKSVKLSSGKKILLWAQIILYYFLNKFGVKTTSFPLISW